MIESDSRTQPKATLSYETVRAAMVARFMQRQWPKAQESDRLNSPYRKALDTFTRTAAAHAQTHQLELTSQVPGVRSPYETLLGDTLVVFARLTHALRTTKVDDRYPWYWTHIPDVLDRARRDDLVPAHRFNLEETAAAYLALPFRSAFMDRLLIDTLLAEELFGHVRAADQAIRPKDLRPPRETLSERLDRSPLAAYAAIRLRFLLTVLVAAYILLEAVPHARALHRPLDPVLMTWLSLGLLSVGLPQLIMSWVRLARDRKAFKASLALRLSVYRDLDSDGQVSAVHLMHRARASSDAGVTWPGAVFVLLDDSIKRGGKLGELAVPSDSYFARPREPFTSTALPTS